MIAPCPPRTSGGGQYQASHGGEGADWNDTSSGYATMNGDFPMSTPKNYDSAVRAYENYQKQGFPIPDTLGTVSNLCFPTALHLNPDFEFRLSMKLNVARSAAARTTRTTVQIHQTAFMIRLSQVRMPL